MWRDRRITLAVRSDSVSALIMLVKMKASGFGVGILSRELALDIGEALYEPNVCSHIPGTTNVIADALSRMTDYSDTAASLSSLPVPLRLAKRRFFEDRGFAWWRSL